MRIAVIVGRLALAALSLAGVLTQLVVSVTGPLGVVNFFSYFTILANIIVIVVFVAGAVALIRGVEPTDRAIALRGASVVYIVFVGIVFTTLLRDVELGALQPWVNVVHHYVMPVAALLDWLLWPPRRPIPIRTALLYLVFPAVYTVYCLVRGPVAGFYPYPFFNPAQPGGYAAVAAYCAGMLVAFLVVALLVRWLATASVRRAGGSSRGR